jgi:hypothetical protein
MVADLDILFLFYINEILPPCLVSLFIVLKVKTSRFSDFCSSLYNNKITKKPEEFPFKRQYIEIEQWSVDYGSRNNEKYFLFNENETTN